MYSSTPVVDELLLKTSIGCDADALGALPDGGVRVAVEAALLHEEELVRAAGLVHGRPGAVVGRAGGGAEALVGLVLGGVELAVGVPEQVVRVAEARGVELELARDRAVVVGAAEQVVGRAGRAGEAEARALAGVDRLRADGGGVHPDHRGRQRRLGEVAELLALGAVVGVAAEGDVAASRRGRRPCRSGRGSRPSAGGP